MGRDEHTPEKCIQCLYRKWTQKNQVRGNSQKIRMSANTPDIKEAIESGKNEIIGTCVLHLFLAFPLSFAVYSMISASGYESRGSIVPPLSPEKIVLLKEAIGMVLGGIFLYWFCRICCYLRQSRYPEKSCSLVLRAGGFVSFLLILTGGILCVLLSARILQ